MHRSPMSVLVILAALAACSTSDATAGTESLTHDSALAARIALAPARRPSALPDACSGVATAAPPAAAEMSRAEELLHQGYAAEALGDLEAARSLLRRASDLDGTNESAAYDLGRTSETLGDRAAAVAAYCRFLTLAPATAEADEARRRVARLSRPESRVAAGRVGDAIPTRRRAQATASRRVAQRRMAPRRATVAHAVLASSPDRDGAAETTSGGEVVATTAHEPTVVQPSAASRGTGRSGPSRAQRAGIGAAAGAIIGAATGRSVKGALIGAGAGGLLGTMTGGGFSPAGRGIRR